ncbi:hypothetical protein EDD86DRAFT_217592 [Gorgonomyces haynaldii]|nr:hypothetical protein EDD86DRAFT_217592 [Gorgonomyces haynaldii]
MASLISEAFVNNTIVPSPPIAQVLEKVATCTAFIGLILVGIVIAATARHVNNASSMLVLAVCCSDGVLHIMSLVTSISNTINGGWGLGKIGCIITYHVAYLSSIESMLTIGLIAFERYMHICRGVEIGWKRMLQILLSLLVGAFLLTLLPLLTGTLDQSVQIVSTASNCIVAFYSQSPVPRAISIMTMVGFWTVSLIIGFSYYSIFATFRRAADSAVRNTKLMTTMQNEALRKCIVLTLFFYCMWALQALNIAGQIHFKRPSLPTVQGIADILLVFHAAFNPILIMYFDKSVYANVRKLLIPSYLRQRSLPTVAGNRSTSVEKSVTKHTDISSELPPTQLARGKLR